jgi:hypothetical protein
MFSRFTLLTTKFARPNQIRGFAINSKTKDAITTFGALYISSCAAAFPVIFCMTVYEDKKMKGAYWLQTRADIMLHATSYSLIVAPFWPVAVIAEILDI